MTTHYGLHVESPYDPKLANMVTLEVTRGEIRKIERTIPGLLVIKVLEAGELVYSENITSTGLYHTYIYVVGKTAKVTVVSKVIASEPVVDLAHKVFLDSDTGDVAIDCSGIAYDAGSIVYTSGVYIASQTLANRARQQARFLLVGEQASISTVPEISAGTDDSIIEHSLAVERIKDSDIEYMTLRGIEPRLAKEILIESFLL